MEEMVDQAMYTDDYMVDTGENIDYSATFNNDNNGNNISTSTIILWITIFVCMAIGITLGIILGRKSAMK